MKSHIAQMKAKRVNVSRQVADYHELHTEKQIRIFQIMKKICNMKITLKAETERNKTWQ